MRFTHRLRCILFSNPYRIQSYHENLFIATISFSIILIKRSKRTEAIKKEEFDKNARAYKRVRIQSLQIKTSEKKTIWFLFIILRIIT